MKSLSHVRLFVTPWTIAYQAPLSMGFSRQEYWSGLPFPSPGDLPNPGIKPRFPALQADSLPAEPPGTPSHLQGPPQISPSWPQGDLSDPCPCEFYSNHCYLFSRSFHFVFRKGFQTQVSPSLVKSSHGLCHGCVCFLCILYGTQHMTDKWCTYFLNDLEKRNFPKLTR